MLFCYGIYTAEFDTQDHALCIDTAELYTCIYMYIHMARPMYIQINFRA